MQTQMQRSRHQTDPRLPNFPAIGTLFDDRYLLEAFLGSGGVGAVFRATDTRLDREIALKILAPTAMDMQGLARFRREALTIAQLQHPSIVTIHDFSKTETHPYLVLEMLPGTDLWAVLYEETSAAFD